ncbi:MAG TPA: Na+/H+ antiporter subunit D [Kiritimatiellia bacterium]|nr:Na+/H+ antiporter subunit D [Kiritimatiellia bacterium]HMO99260.1 Na+/H+ antiporter subunit D [Kiritimatiellia bacterium]HMP96948.1 Na+/H+ antiporter subunit D [Kiritimatiellia bacterium]
MNALPALPILLPLLTGIVCILMRGNLPAQRMASIAGCLLQLVVAVVLMVRVGGGTLIVAQMGDWAAPYGITLVVDVLSAIMLVMSGLLGLLSAVYGLVTMDERRERHYYHAFFQILLMGVNGSFLTGDLFNLYVWFEVMLMASFVLLALGGERPQLEGAIKYVALNFLASALFLAAVGILYGLTGTLNMADLALVLRGSEDPGLITTVSMLFLVAFGIKAAIFPLFFWLPASYHTPPAPVSAIFAGLLTKVGVYALLRMFTLVFTPDTFTLQLILMLAAFTMVTGVLGAAAQMNFRRLLAFHIISQIGYMIMGLGLFTQTAIAAAIFYMVHNIIAKTNLFLIAGIVSHKTGIHDLKQMGGLFKAQPLFSVGFLIAAMALAGLPPLSGFFGKWSLAQSGFAVERYAVTAIALGVGLLTLFSMTKIWNEAFWKPRPADSPLPATPWTWTTRERIALMGPVALLAACSVALGLGAGWALDLCGTAATQLLNPAAYLEAVLPGGARP